MGHNSVKKSCMRTNKTNYCRVQFMDDNDPFDHAGITPPESPIDSSSSSSSSTFDHCFTGDNSFPIQEKTAIVTSLQNQQVMYEPLYKKEKKKTQLLESQIQHLQLQLMDKDRKLALNENSDYKYAKVSRLVNEILSLSRNDDDNDNQLNPHPIVQPKSSPTAEPKSSSSPSKKTPKCTSTLENIHDRLQNILFNLMVTQQQQQTRLQYNPHDDYQHTTSIYYY